MKKFFIDGGTPLNGELTISGAKNAVLPILMGALLTDGDVTVCNVPNLQDVTTTLQLLATLGAQISIRNNLTITINSSTVNNQVVPSKLVRAMRASILVLGPLLAKYGYVKSALPGGCAIGGRPVDLHIAALERLGAEIQVKDGYIIAHAPNGLRGAEFTFPKISVTGTENLLLAASLASGTTMINNAACEPEVVDLANFLNKMGANISGAGTSQITCTGVKKLAGCEHTVIPDRIETGTYLIAAAITHGKITLKNTNPNLLIAVLNKLQETGVSLDWQEDWITIDARNITLKAVDVLTAEYPGIPTDMQAQFMALNTVAKGESFIKERIFENRFLHVPELQRMGAQLEYRDNIVYCKGNAQLVGAQVKATDLRASAGLVLAALNAKGHTIIDKIHHIHRGYACIEEKLRNLGAKIACADEI